MLVDGREAPIFGKDECPPANTRFMTSIFGADSEDGRALSSRPTLNGVGHGRVARWPH